MNKLKLTVIILTLTITMGQLGLDLNFIVHLVTTAPDWHPINIIPLANIRNAQ
jgi:hypothetical protein